MLEKKNRSQFPVDQALKNLWEPKILLFILVVLYNNVGFRRYIRLKI